jgi:23S rRNA (adenine2503-C2)-methyltransferase
MNQYKQSILDFTLKELEATLKPSFRAKQIYNWLYVKQVNSFDEMVNLPKQMRQDLANSYRINALKIIKKEISKDRSEKYLFELHDGLSIEAVLLPMKPKQYHHDGALKHHEKYTICVSSQVGCKVGCAFCLTAKEGFKRDLSPGEIIDQVLQIKKDHNIPQERRVNVVYMGMGEPLDNLDSVVKAIKIFSELDGMAIGPRRQTISTSGLSSKIEKLGHLDLGVLLAISLHAVDDATRVALMPINKAYNIASVVEAVKNFPIDARKRVMFEYLLIQGINDDIASAQKLVKLLQGIKAKVNLILFNPHPGSEFQRPTSKDAIAFQEYLLSKGLLCTIRQSKGLDISAACGQLREKTVNDTA